MMQVPDHTVIGRVDCPNCGLEYENLGDPGSLVVVECPCPATHGSIARPLAPGEDEGDIYLGETP